MTCGRPDGARRVARQCSIGAVLVLLSAASFTAAGTTLADDGRGDCLGVGFDAAHSVPIAKIIADRAEVHFIKNANGDSCLEADCLMPGDLVLVGKTRGDYRCVSYQSAATARRGGPAGCRRRA